MSRSGDVKVQVGLERMLCVFDWQVSEEPTADNSTEQACNYFLFGLLSVGCIWVWFSLARSCCTTFAEVHSPPPFPICSGPCILFHRIERQSQITSISMKAQTNVSRSSGCHSTGI